MGERYLVRVRVADDPAALPEEGEEGIVYEYDVMDKSRLMFTTYDKADADLAAKALNKMENRSVK